MAKAYNERCIVLKHTKLGETDAIVTMLASDGSQVRAVAKGLRKPASPPNSSRSSDVTASCWVSACTR